MRSTSNTPLRAAIIAAYRKDESQCVNELLQQINLPKNERTRIFETARKLVIGARKRNTQAGGIHAFLHQYDLSSEEGIALMCLAEALLRIPDTHTIDLLISDKISTANWLRHLNKSSSLFVNTATWSLLLTGKIYSQHFNPIIRRAAGAIIRPIILQSMKIMGKQFVTGRTIQEALRSAKKLESIGYRYSYDMLGEAARTQQDAERYFQSYLQAISAIGAASTTLNPIQGPGISIKLSALHPRYEYANHANILRDLVPRLLVLAQTAKAQNIGMTIDAEEADRLDLSLDIIEAVFTDPSLNNWEGFGLAVQSYQKRAPFVIDWLADLAKQQGRRLMVRLIKGAYWDAEIKQSQLLGLEGYPVFTRKNSTDISFLACAKKLLAHPDCFYPQFGTHNAYSVAAILEMAGARKDYEFQCLHGMGRPLYDQIVGKNLPCRIYAPVGSHKELLGYLVRRLLENGANTSFINRLADKNISIEKIILDPVARIAELINKPHPHIPLPQDIFGMKRKNSTGLDLSNSLVLTNLNSAIEKAAAIKHTANPIIAGKEITTAKPEAIKSPSNLNIIVGYVHEASKEDVEHALTSASHSSWKNKTVQERAVCLERAADLFEENRPELIALLCHEGGKHIVDCISEIREAVDFCRYYAERAREDLVPQILSGPTGEFNQLSLHPRGIIACISPWNFPFAIFIGQVVAALVTGNTVIAKPAEQTPLIAAEAVRLLHAAGISKDALHLLPGRGEIVGATLTADERVAGVMFTGSTDTAKLIQQTLSNRKGAIVPLIAETGGQNVMIVDSSALPEQVVADIIQSSFNSAGQRCSASRVLFVQEDIADGLIDMLKGAMAELKIGDPSLLATDVGPVIDADALAMLKNHVTRMNQEATLLYQVSLPATLAEGHFFAPCAFELKTLNTLKQEVFGPILHVIRFAADDLDKVLDAIIETGYGLTLGIHSRIDATVKHIQDRAPVGNLYVNRNMIGAVVGVQPFGGEGLSGTGPKAGGPHYLPRLCVERAISINTTAGGGNARLVSLAEDD